MSLQFSIAIRNARLDTIQTTIGTSPKLNVYTGAAPASCAATELGTLLCSMTLPSSWMGNAASGAKSKSGTWSGSGEAAGNAGHFRILDSAGTNCHVQGSVSATGGGGDMTMDNINIAVSQSVSVNTFTLTDGNA